MRTQHWFPRALAALILGGLAAACVVPAQPGPAVPDDPVPGPGQGLLQVKWAPEARAILGSSWASAAADVYELVLLGSGGTNAAFTLNLGSGQVLSVDQGTYRALVLAGVRRSSGSTTAYLVGSAVAEGVVVAEGQRTSVALTLKSLDLTLGPTGPVYWKSTSTLRAAGLSRNPRVGMSLAGTSTTQRPRFKSTELWAGYREMASVTGTPDAWTADATAVIPAAGASFAALFVGSAVVVQGLDGTWGPTTGLTAFTWAWPNGADVAEGHPILGPTSFTFAAGPPPTGLEVGLGWE